MEDLSNERFDITELRVCVVCIHLLANGEYNDGTDVAELAHAGMIHIWGEDAKHLVPGGGDGDGDYGFCTSQCDGCGDTCHGDRYQAYAMIPKV
jgi:hypothetical protein